VRRCTTMDNESINKLMRRLDRLQRDVRRALRLLEHRGDPEGDLTIREFCLSEDISRSKFYELQKQNRAPRVMQISKQVKRITAEARRDWRREREAESVAQPEGP
jgi:predicted DNA-binding transcriptional regulator AlpA